MRGTCNLKISITSTCNHVGLQSLWTALARKADHLSILSTDSFKEQMVINSRKWWLSKAPENSDLLTKTPLKGTFTLTGMISVLWLCVSPRSHRSSKFWIIFSLAKMSGLSNQVPIIICIKGFHIGGFLFFFSSKERVLKGGNENQNLTRDFRNWDLGAHTWATSQTVYFIETSNKQFKPGLASPKFSPSYVLTFDLPSKALLITGAKISKPVSAWCRWWNPRNL